VAPGGIAPSETAAVALADATGTWLAILGSGGGPRALSQLAKWEGGGGRGANRLRSLLSALAVDRHGRRQVAAAVRGALREGATTSLLVAAPGGARRLVVTPAPWDTGGALISVLPGDPSDQSLVQLLERARALEAELRARTLDLTISEERYRDLFEATPDLYLVADAQGRIVEVNRTALRATGYRREELQGRRFLRLIAPESRQKARAAIPSLIETGRLENLEITIRRRDGTPVDVSVNAVIARDELGKVRGMHAVLRDITSRQLLQRQLLQADRLVATGRLAAGMAHEINNPLQAILLHLSLVEGVLPLDFVERGSFERVREGVHRIRQIVAALLDLHRGGDQALESVRIGKVLDEVLGLSQTPLRHAGVRVVRDLAPQLPPVLAVERHVYQVLLNLVLNALDAMRGGGQLTVRTRHHAASSEIEIDIGDTGTGIPEKLLPQIFDPFFTGGGEGKTGLGLFVTYGLVRQHGGRLQVDSQPGRGTTFRVFFPESESEQPEPGNSAGERTAAST